MSVMNKKRGVSSIIGYVLLVSFMLILGVTVYLLLKTYVPGEVDNCPDETSLLIKSYECNSNQLILNLKNDGNFDIGGYFIYATTSPQQETATLDLSRNITPSIYRLYPRGVKFGEVGEEENSLSPNQDGIGIYNLTGLAQIYSVEITPIRWQEEDGKNLLVTCTNAKIEKVLDCSGVCIPSCVEKTCGDDGCGINNNCGICTIGTCNSLGKCVTSCTDTCLSLGYTCGIQSVCENYINCGTCWDGETCQTNGTCMIIPCTDTCLSLGYECGNYTICEENANCGDCLSGSTCQTGTCMVIPTGDVYYLSPTGSDTTGDGSITKPWFSLNKAWTVVVAGDTIYMRGGTYRYDIKQLLSGKDGAAGKMIKIWAFGNEKPIISPSQTFTDTIGISISSLSYLHIKGLEITGFEQREASHWYYGIATGNINNCIFEQLNVHHNGFGLTIGSWGTGTSTGNLVLNSDFHHNSDSLTQIDQATPWGGSDGLTIRVVNPNATNTISGCRMWWNSDDGLDLWSNEGMIILNNSWAFWNGFQPGNFANAGDGNGFKLGPTYEDGYPMKREITNNLAFQNKLWGFVDNAAECNMEIYNNVAYQNCYQNYETWCGGYFFHLVPGIPYYMKNNIAYNQAGGYDVLLDTLTNINHNSWDTSGVSVTNADFVSVIPTGVDGPRKADGSLPDINFLHLASGSDLIDKGVNVGLPYSGSAPDMGTFETNY
jgi:hypothetical protein